MDQKVPGMMTLLNYLFVSTVFLGGFLLCTSPIEFYDSYILVLLFLVFYVIRYRRVEINPSFLIIVLILTISSLVNVWFGKDTELLMLKQVLGILVTGTAYYLLIKINGYDVKKLFKIYLQIALIVAAIGIFQEYSFLIGFKNGYDYSGFIPMWRCVPATGGMLRLNSIFMEPSHYAITMAPALFVSMSNILRKRQVFLNTWVGSIVIIISYILTFSTVAYIAIVIGVLLFVNIRDFKNLIILSIVTSALMYAAYRYEPEIHMRVDSTIGVATGSKDLTSSHLSVYTIVSNGFVAFKSFMSDPIFGSGLGSHPLSYDKFIHRIGLNDFWSLSYTLVNRMDAGSLFLRLLSETGLFGLIAVLYFVFKFRLKIGDKKELPILSNAVFILFVLQLLKQGHYFYDGLFFFVWMYYFAYQLYFKPNLRVTESKSN